MTFSQESYRLKTKLMVLDLNLKTRVVMTSKVFKMMRISTAYLYQNNDSEIKEKNVCQISGHLDGSCCYGKWGFDLNDQNQLSLLHYLNIYKTLSDLMEVVVMENGELSLAIAAI